ncbi:hypothetical protein AK828_11065 [Cutibacterium acnes]|nr:hypothetical protein AK828_11065 [Cutibacterium acnes]KPG65913.1 hypothetical protein AK827_03530 [Cutibacterium acnes]
MLVQALSNSKVQNSQTKRRKYGWAIRVKLLLRADKFGQRSCDKIPISVQLFKEVGSSVCLQTMFNIIKHVISRFNALWV